MDGERNYRQGLLLWPLGPPGPVDFDGIERRRGLDNEAYVSVRLGVVSNERVEGRLFGIGSNLLSWRHATVMALFPSPLLLSPCVFMHRSSKHVERTLDLKNSGGGILEPVFQHPPRSVLTVQPPRRVHSFAAQRRSNRRDKRTTQCAGIDSPADALPRADGRQRTGDGSDAQPPAPDATRRVLPLGVRHPLVVASLAHPRPQGSQDLGTIASPFGGGDEGTASKMALSPSPPTDASRAEEVRHVRILINRYHHVDRVIVSSDPKHLVPKPGIKETPDKKSDSSPSDRHGNRTTTRLQRMDRLRRKRAVIRSAVTGPPTSCKLYWIPRMQPLEAALKAVDGEIEDGVDIDHPEEEMESVEAYQVSICRLRTRATPKLDGRFGQTQAIIDDHMTRLLNLKNVTTSSDVTALRRLYDDITINVRSLEAFGVKAEEYSVLLHAAVKKRLPDDLVVRYCQQRATDIADSTGSLQTFLNFLKFEVESRERVLEIKPDQASPSKAQKEDSSNQVHQAYVTPSAAGLAARTDAQDAKCLFCDAREHSFDQCNARSISEKKEILERDGRCFRCCKRYHRARDCRNARILRCANCQGRHMTCLCDPDLKPTKDSPHSSSQPVTSEVSVTSAVSNGVETVLQTATIWTEGETKRRLFRCLLDVGSQRTFVTTRLVNELSCKVLGKEDLKITVFGDTALANASKLRKVEVRLQSQHDRKRVRIEALEVPAICHSSAFPVSLCRTAQSCTLQLADLSCSGFKRDIDIDVLIGADNYWKAVTGSIKRLDGDLTAVETIFGWTLQGPVRPSPEVGWHQATLMQVMTRHQSEQPSQQLREKNALAVPEDDVPEPKQSTITSVPVPEKAIRKDSDVESGETEALEWAPCTVLTPCNSPGNSRESGFKDDREAADAQLLSDPVGCQHELSASNFKEASGIPDVNVMSNDRERDEETPTGAVETRENILKPANLISVSTEIQEGKVVSIDCKKFRKRDRPGGIMGSPSKTFESTKEQLNGSANRKAGEDGDAVVGEVLGGLIEKCVQGSSGLLGYKISTETLRHLLRTFCESNGYRFSDHGSSSDHGPEVPPRITRKWQKCSTPVPEKRTVLTQSQRRRTWESACLNYSTRKSREEKTTHSTSLPSRNSDETVGLTLLGGRMLKNGHGTTKKWATGSRAEEIRHGCHWLSRVIVARSEAPIGQGALVSGRATPWRYVPTPDKAAPERAGKRMCLTGGASQRKRERERAYSEARRGHFTRTRVDGYYLHVLFPEESVRSALNYKPVPGDVFIGSRTSETTSTICCPGTEHRGDPNVFFLTYEDLKKDTRAWILRIADFLGEEYGRKLRADQGLLEDILKRTSLETMKEMNAKVNETLMELKDLPEDEKPGWLKHSMKTMGIEATNQPVAGDFIRKGAVGDWKNYFSADQVKRLKERIELKTHGSDVMDLWKDIGLP
ncbi:hypothetical protein HPB47_027148 [Ixodes persulcatus]|uniref:Uncharacterized protein n=1 Tax=Ixodes persulcatus TaxID=34615 RepID=A0AC60PXY7_IXOPE|nr:hypothetical protein HPB47_027148 [Ixodes persulcatus]